MNSDTAVERDHPNFDPNLDFKHRPNVRRVIKTPEFEYEVLTNGLGFRIAELSPSGNGIQRLMLLGDSMFEGVGMHEHAPPLAPNLNIPAALWAVRVSDKD
ncbi:MAG: hypothetical protein O3C28_19085 [Proteobacteria bacterium]|nr:hypothetical protein [Pseudomonadota bacterium]